MIFFIFISAFILRLVSLNQSLWLDEGTTARVVQHYGFFQIVSKFSPSDFHPPLYYLLMKLWTGFFGYSEISLRMPSVLFSLLTAWIIYLIGKKNKNASIGFWAAAFFLFNPLIVYYSQEARMYMMATFLLAAALYYFLELSRSKKLMSSLLLFNLFIFLSFLTFYGSIFFIAALYFYLLFKKKYQLLFQLLPGLLLSLIIVFPLLQKQWMNSRQALILIANWKNVLGQANIKNLLLIPLKFSLGRISFEPKKLYYIIGGLWSLLVFWLVSQGTTRSRNKFGIMLGTFLIFPIFLGFVFSFFTPLLQYFRFIYLIPIMALLLSFSTSNRVYRLIVICGFAVLSTVYLFNPTFHREDWKSLAKSLAPKQEVYMIPSSSDALRYYNKAIIIHDIRDLKQLPHSLIILPYTTDIYGIDYKKILLSNGFVLKESKTFRGLSYEVWESKIFYSLR